MNPSKGYYSIIQYCPDRSRMEVANIGVLLACPDQAFMRARIARTDRRIRRFFGTTIAMDKEQLAVAKEMIAERVEVYGKQLKSLGDLEEFIQTRANEIVLTNPRPVKVVDPGQELDRLFDLLVGEEAEERAAPSAPKALRQRLQRSFEEARVLDHLQKNVEVEIPTRQRKLVAPFAFRNGTLNLIIPAAFDQTSPRTAEQRACSLSVQGGYIRQHRHEKYGELEMKVVADFGQNRDEIRNLVRQILDVNSVQVYDIGDLHLLTEMIRKAVAPQRT